MPQCTYISMKWATAFQKQSQQAQSSTSHPSPADLHYILHRLRGALETCEDTKRARQSTCKKHRVSGAVDPENVDIQSLHKNMNKFHSAFARGQAESGPYECKHPQEWHINHWEDVNTSETSKKSAKHPDTPSISTLPENCMISRRIRIARFSTVLEMHEFPLCQHMSRIWRHRGNIN